MPFLFGYYIRIFLDSITTVIFKGYCWMKISDIISANMCIYFFLKKRNEIIKKTNEISILFAYGALYLMYKNFVHQNLPYLKHLDNFKCEKF